MTHSVDYFIKLLFFMLLGTVKCIYATILRTLLELMQLMQYAVDFNGKNEHKC